MKRESAAVRFLYQTPAGRLCLKFLTCPQISRLLGGVLDGRVSRPLIPYFIKRHQIDMSEVRKQSFRSFNDFFKRSLIPGSRPFDPSGDCLISPCDGALRVCELDGQCMVSVKHSRYSMRALLKNARLADSYRGGLCLIFRLRPTDYHHYCYIDRGRIVGRRTIAGVLHCVRPAALEKYPVHVRNSREYTVIDSEHFGRIVQMEVGALLVGRISNDKSVRQVERGMEKGYFEFGGSTVIVLLRPGTACMDENILKRSRAGRETEVRQGERIGWRVGNKNKCSENA